MRNVPRRPRHAVAAAVGAVVLATLPSDHAGAAISTDAFCQNIPGGQSGFGDIDAAAPHVRNIECLKGSGVTAGVTATTYEPAREVTRGQMATFIANAVDVANDLDAPGGTTIPDLPTAEASSDAFTDDDGSVHEANINRLRQAGIVSGQTATTFNVAATVNRGQMATFVAQALAFVRGAALPTGTDAFDDDDGTTHESNINRLANADIVDGTSAATFAPDRPVVRSQMASFVVQSLADLHDDGIIGALPIGERSGVVTSVGDDSYLFTSGNQSLFVPYDSVNDRFFVDGAEASEAAFEAAITVGDDIALSDDPSTAPEDADVHRLTNVDPATRRSGTVGNVDISANRFAIIDAVESVTIGGPHTYAGDILQIAGEAVDEATFEASLSEGDTVVGTVGDGGAETWNLTDVILSGTVTEVTDVLVPGDGLVAFAIGGLGDDHKSPADTHFTTGDEVPPNGEAFTVDGATATAQQFEAALTVGDAIEYRRDAGVETFELTNMAPPSQTGVATDARTAGTANDGGSFTMAVGADDVDVAYSNAATFTVDGIVVTEAELEAAYTPGDAVTSTPEDPSAGGNQERVALTNADLIGLVDDVDTTLNTYDVVNDQGNLLDDDRPYSGAGNLYFRNGTAISEAQFEALLTKIDADTTPDDSIVVRVVSGSTEHRLTTDETP